jgi:hypothetical protein
VSVVDAAGDWLRSRILKGQHSSPTHEQVEAEAGKTDLIAAPAALIGVQVGNVLQPILEFLEVHSERFVAVLAREIPEGQCLDMTTAHTISHGAAPRFKVSAHLQGEHNEAGQVGFLYELRICEGRDKAVQFSDLLPTHQWHLEQGSPTSASAQ